MRGTRDVTRVTRLLASYEPRHKKHNAIQRQPRDHDEVPVNSHHRGVGIVFLLDRSDQHHQPDQKRLDRTGKQVREMHSQNRPGYRAVCVGVVARVKSMKLKATEYDCDDSEEDAEHEPAPHACRRLVHTRGLRCIPEWNHADDQQKKIDGRNADVGRRRTCRRPRVEVATNVEVAGSENCERGALKDNHQAVAPPDRRMVAEGVIREYRYVRNWPPLNCVVLKAMLRYCFLSSMLPFTLLALMSRPPFPILPDA